MLEADSAWQGLAARLEPFASSARFILDDALVGRRGGGVGGGAPTWPLSEEFKHLHLGGRAPGPDPCVPGLARPAHLQRGSPGRTLAGAPWSPPGCYTS